MAPRMSKTVEQRLEEIKDLQNKGLITDDEAKKAREHVLNDL
jgi:cytochrome c-type biogenesis protein CcmH/NrfG